MTGTTSLEQRMADLEDRFAIRELVASFVFAVDDRNFGKVAALFTAGGRFRYVNGSINLTGREAIVAHFELRYAALSLTNHVSHDQLIEFIAPGRARGLVSSHVEVCRDGRAMVTATRFTDLYEREETALGNVWRFADRALSILYYLPVSDYAQLLGQPNRNRSGPEPGPADLQRDSRT